MEAMQDQLLTVTAQLHQMATRIDHLEAEVEHLRGSHEVKQLAKEAASTECIDQRGQPIDNTLPQTDRTSTLLKQVFGLSHNIGGMQSMLTMDNLRNDLRQWNLAASPETHASIAQSIRHKYVRNCSLLVSDMSGFTRITKEEGICHFLMLVKQMQAMCIPLMESFGGTLVKVEADNLFVIFPSPHLAVLASMHCQASARKYNQERRRNDQLHLSMSVVHGDLFLIPGVDLFGGVVPMGFELGEDVADMDETLVTEEVVSVCKQQAVIDGLVVFEQAEPFVHGGKNVGVYRAVPVLERILPSVTSCSMPVLNPQINSEEPAEYVALMDERMHHPSKAAQIDAQLKKRFTERSTVLVIDLHFDDPKSLGNEEADLLLLDSIVRLKSEAARLCEKHCGQPVASMQTRASPCIFALFSASAAAFSAAVDFAAICCASDKGITSYGRCSPSLGLAVGDVLNLGFCNAFGDPINVAFKLGEDVAEPRQLLVHEDVIADIDAHAKRHGQPLSVWDLQPAFTQVSGVTLSYKLLTLSVDDPQLKQRSSEIVSANTESAMNTVEMFPKKKEQKKREGIKLVRLVTGGLDRKSRRSSEEEKSPTRNSFFGRLAWRNSRRSNESPMHIRPS
mmetsp:Transcript_3875/g.7523  ORF Transcript_3875/g.7523 Transcript_3875/m.7523 type:complete len:621 (-) Transcript_3875:589-2451(-)